MRRDLRLRNRLVLRLYIRGLSRKKIAWSEKISYALVIKILHNLGRSDYIRKLPK